MLVIDEWLLGAKKQGSAQLLLELLDARFAETTTIFCSQIAPEGWYEKLGEALVADAILDRIIHDSYSILLDGEISMRERHGLKSKL